MTKTNDFSTRIYADVLDQIHGVISTLDQGMLEDRQSGDQSTVKEVLDSVEQTLHHLVDDLRDSAEWNTFTIAFYGETNAGKSTLIECLRILLKESSKAAQRQEFRALQKQFGLYENDMNLLEQQADKLERRQADAKQKMSEADCQYGQQENALAHKAQELRQRIIEKKQSVGWLQRMTYMVHKLPEEAALQQVQQQLARLPEQHAIEIERLQRQQRDAQVKHEHIMAQHQTALAHRHQLEAYEDGVIISDRRANFTSETQQYTFEVKGQSFRILDVPGIDEYRDSTPGDIQNIVKRAHAVFYVTSNAVLPEVGDEGQPDALEKIKAHLGAQTNVWTVFNKRITNPRVLRKAALVSNDEQAGLAKLDSRMREVLGRHYRRSLSLSALPGFLALADCLTPLSSKAMSRKTFIDSLTAEKLFQASGVEAFQQLLTQDLIRDSATKIRRANLNKISVAIQSVCDVMERMRDDQFLPLQNDLHKEAEYACRQLDLACNDLDRNVSNIGRQAILAFGARVREQIYAEIEEDISNDDFEIRLRKIMEKEQRAMQEHLPEPFDHNVELFKQQVASVIERFKEHARDILNGHDCLPDSMMPCDLAVEVRIDRRINLDGLIASVVGSALTWHAVRWRAMPLGEVKLLTGLFKSIWGFFSDDYCKSQQRKAAEKNIRKAYRELSHAYRRSQRGALQPLKGRFNEIKALLWAPVTQTGKVCQAIDVADAQLKQVAEEIIVKGEKR